MAHRHETCTNPTGEGVLCENGVLTGYCDYEDCSNPWCSYGGHCGCKCHSGRTCAGYYCGRECGHEWPRMEKMAKIENKEGNTGE